MAGWSTTCRIFPCPDSPSRISPQPGFVVGQCLVEEPLSRTVESQGMVAGFPDIETYEYIYVLLIQNHRHTRPPCSRVTVCAGWSTAAGVGIHVTKDPSSCLYQRSAAAKPVPATTPPGS